MNSVNKKIIVVGAGPGGLASAMLLAHRGFDVTVFEKQAQIGGRNAEIRLGPYRFDVGPTFLMMKYLLDELFLQMGTTTDHYIDCQRLDPMYRLQFGARRLHVTGNREQMRKNIEAVFPGEAQGLDQFYAREEKRFDRIYPCLQKTYGTLDSFLSFTLLKALPHLALGRSLYDVLSGYFKAEELRLAFTFQSKYLGMSPWDCPGLFGMIPYTEHAHGVYHVKGGLCEISRGFARAAEERGAVIRTSTLVRQILVKAGKACGVILEDGTEHRCDDVVVNADFGHAVQNLFPGEALKKWTPARLNEVKLSCSTFMLYLGLDKIYDCDFHSIFFANNYKKNLEDISVYLRLSDDFSVYVRNASIKDPSLAPAGHSALYLLVPVPNNRSGINWLEQKQPFRDKVIRLLETKTPYQGLSQHIREEQVITPEDWEKKRDVYRGATFNLGHQFSQMLYFRPHNQFEDIRDSYLVGGGTHPGSGLPTIFESARIAADLLSKKYGLSYMAPRPFRAGIVSHE